LRVHSFLNESVTELTYTYVEQEIGAVPTSPSPSIGNDVCRSGTPIRNIILGLKYRTVLDRRETRGAERSTPSI